MDVVNQLFNGMGTLGLGIALMVALPFLLVALVLVFVVLRAGRKVRASQNWQATSGRVLMSYVDPRRSHRSTGGTSTAYYPVVVYEYAVNGQRLQSNRIRFGGEIGYGWTSPAQKKVDEYPQGALIEVFYNPDQPTEAVLERTARSSNRLLTCGAVLIIGMVLFSLIMSFGAFAFTEQIVEALGIGQLIDGATK